jgi:ferrochelatase
MASNPQTPDKKKLAVVLMNLGGPDSLSAVQPFLYNLFSDPAMLPGPTLLRKPLAWILSHRRLKKAQGIYAQLGGSSPLYENTQRQARALEKALTDRLPTQTSKVFIAMRHWHPFTDETVHQINRFSPNSVVVLPLYPQFSNTTTGSSLTEWSRHFQAPFLKIDGYCTHPGLIEAYRDLILKEWQKVPPNTKMRLLFSAHGLPKRLIDQGDPYQEHVEQTASCLKKRLQGDLAPSTDFVVCYQSKVGKLEWTGPSLDDEIIRAKQDNVGVLVVPISFVSEHSETLVELDQDYAQRARTLGIPYYGRIQTVMDHELFIQGLASLVEETVLSSLQPHGRPL